MTPKSTKTTESFRSVLALVAAAVAVGMLVDPTAMVGQAPAKGGAPGGKAEKAPPGPIPRTKEGKPDMSGFWGGVTPGGKFGPPLAVELHNLPIACINFARKMGSRIGGLSLGDCILVHNDHGLSLAR